MKENTSKQHHEAFLASDRQHNLMITNHGIYQWTVIPGLPDTGGQNLFVSQFTETLARQRFKITLANRRGYPHPLTDEMRNGLNHMDEHQRILYLEDEDDSLVHNENMKEHRPQLARRKTVLFAMGGRNLCELSDGELQAVADARHDAIGVILRLMPMIGSETAFNATVHNGPGAGLYVEFLPFTQETGGFDHLRLSVYQRNTQDAAATLRLMMGEEHVHLEKQHDYQPEHQHDRGSA